MHVNPVDWQYNPSQCKHGTRRINTLRPDETAVQGLPGGGSVKEPAGSSSSSDVPERRTIDYGPLPNLVGYQVRKAYSQLFQTFTDMLQEVGLAPGQYSALLLIGLNPGLSQMALADATGTDRSSIVPITKRFAKEGWVQRTRRTADRRLYSLRLTPLGESILHKAERLIEAHEKQFVAPLRPAERVLLRKLLARIADADTRESTATNHAKSDAPPADARDAARRFARGSPKRHTVR
jgi:DNA-binding MarR family transcriptional regulator